MAPTIETEPTGQRKVVARRSNVPIQPIVSLRTGAGALEPYESAARVPYDAEDRKKSPGVAYAESNQHEKMLRLLSWGSSMAGEKLMGTNHSCMTSRETPPRNTNLEVHAGPKHAGPNAGRHSNSKKLFKRNDSGFQSADLNIIPTEISLTTLLSPVSLPEDTMDSDEPPHDQSPSISENVQPNAEDKQKSPTTTPGPFDTLSDEQKRHYRRKIDALANDNPDSTKMTITAFEDLSDEQKRRYHRIIDEQFGLEILMKHREMRLIEQELAKCQIAYEQLRRCHEIPYQAASSTAVSHPTGSTARRSGLRQQPESPAPWGVTDGPYTRHYAQWLLPDTKFDGLEHGSDQLSNVQSPKKSRGSRGSLVDYATMAGKGRSSMTVPGLPTRAAPPQIQSHPPIALHKRKSDGAWVKFKCIDCQRSNWSSPQGFINHCRIQHRHHYASHDAAAEEAGVKVEVDGTGAVAGQEQEQETQSNLTHPLIRNPPPLSPLKQSASIPSRLSTQHSHPDLSSRRSVTPKKRSHKEVSTKKSSFKSSSSVPNLSELVQSRGLGINLLEMVNDAKRRSAPDPFESDSEYESDEYSPAKASRTGGGRRVPTKAKKGVSQSPQAGAQVVAQSPQIQRIKLGLRGGGGAEDDAMSAHPGIEPSPTESHHAPSLVDDDGDADEAHSPPASVISPDEAMSVDFHIEDGDDMNDSQTGYSLSTLSREDPKHPVAMSSSSQRHVSFVSEAPKGLTEVTPAVTVDSTPNDKKSKKGRKPKSRH